MSVVPVSLRLKRDQIFGLHACVPEAEWPRLRTHLGATILEFSDGWVGASRLDEPGCRTVMFLDDEEQVRISLAAPGMPLALASEIELLTARYPAHFAALLEAGEPARDGSPLKNANASFGEGDVEALVKIMSDPELHAASSESTVVWAPLQALRVLGVLRAEAAIVPALEQLRRIDEDHDAWISGEVESVLAKIGPAAVAPTAAYLRDETHGKYARLAAARSLAQVARAWPEQRAACVAAIELQLGAHLVQEPEFNGLLISALLDIPAPDAAPTIERAFANDRVDEFVAGDWEDVQIELGLKLQRENPPKPNEWTRMGAQARESLGLPDTEEMSDVAPIPPNPVEASATPYRAPPKVGRNDPCPCGSGKKYKKCCGA